jgi:hypothetical protein
LLGSEIVENKGFFFFLAQLTRAGIAVVDLLGRSDERPILRKLAEEAPAGSFSRIVMGRCVGGGRFGPPIEQLFPEVPSFSMPPIYSASPFSTPSLAKSDRDPIHSANESNLL